MVARFASKMKEEKRSDRRSLNYRDIVKKRIPILRWLPQYNTTSFFHDLLAGFTVALTEVPQAIAYASIAGLSPEYGLYCGFMGGFLYFIFGSCKDLNIGPTSLLALLLQPHVQAMGPAIAILMSFLSGLIIFSMGLFHLGFLIEFFSYPITAGFTCAASLQIASTQLKSLLGIPGPADDFLESIETISSTISETKKWDLLLGIVSIVILVILKEIRVFGSLAYRKDWSPSRNIFGKFIFMLSLARNAIVVAFGTFLAYHLQDSKPFSITGEVKAGFPPLDGPPFATNHEGKYYSFQDMVQNLGTSIVFIPLVSILEAVSIAKTFSNGRALDATQEMIALGICNVMGSLVSGMPVTGSFTRTAINNSSGARTTLSGLISSCFVLLTMAFLTEFFHYVPKATLAALIMCAMFYLFDFNAFLVLWRSKKLDLIPFLTTFLCCLFVSLEYGILIGIGVNLLFVLYGSARPKFTLTQETSPATGEEVIMVTIKDTLYFPAAEYLRDTLLEFDCDHIIAVINGQNIRSMDVTVAKAMLVLAQEFTARKQRLIFLNFSPSVVEVCSRVDSEIIEFFITGDIKDVVNISVTIDL